MNTALSSRDNLIAIARDLIIDRGFSAMSVSTVCAAAKVTKGSFFHHFSSKDELGEVVLEKFWKDVQERHAKAGYLQAGNPLDVLYSYIDHAIETYQDPEFRGCLLAVFTSELKETHPALYAKSIPYFVEWKAEVEELLRNAAKFFQPRGPFDATIWAELYISAVEGVLILAKAENNPQVIARVLNLFRDQLKLLFPYQR